MSTAGSPRYVALLKGKQGELDALGDTAALTRRVMIPLVEVVPGNSSVDDPVGVSSDCQKVVERLASRWTGPVMLDAGLLDQDLDLDGRGHGAVHHLAGLARSRRRPAQPVLRLGDPAMALADVADVGAHDRHGLTIRLLGDDLDEEPNVVEAALQAVVRRTQVDRGEIDLLLDLAEVQGALTVRSGARLVLSLLRGMTAVDGWRSVTVAAGAFPVDLSRFTAWVVGEHARDDAALYDAVSGRWSGRRLDYGDYAVAHPSLGQGAPFAPPPQLRYAIADRWLVLKGRRNDPRGHTQFYDICDVISGNVNFSGTALGAADLRIAHARTDGPGNGTTWRRIGTTHHMDLVARRLTSLGEP